MYAARRERQDMLKLDHSSIACPRNAPCSCDFHLVVTPKGVESRQTTIDRRTELVVKTNDDMFKELAVWLEEQFHLTPGGIFPRRRHTDRAYIVAKLGRAMEIVAAPFSRTTLPQTMELPHIAPGVVKSVLIADFLDVQDACPGMYVTLKHMLKYVWEPTPFFPNHHFIPTGTVLPGSVNQERYVPTLAHLAMRAYGIYSGAFGLRNGFPQVRTALAHLHENHKYANVILQASDRDTKVVTPLQREALQYTHEALDRVHRALGTQDKIGKVPAEFLPASFQRIVMRSSDGLYAGVPRRYTTEEGVRYTITPTGIKYQNYRQVITALFNHIDTKTPFAVYWAISPKAAMDFSTEDQLDEATYEKWCAKHRIFIIPSSIFIYAERMVMYLRKLLEQNTDIKIGFKWPRGGADFLFAGYNLVNALFADGDFSKLDQTIHQVLMRLFYSTTMIYFGPGKDRSAMEWIVEQLVNHVSARVTHLMEDLWARVMGQMPSGAWGTSHGDSWIVLFLYYLFVSATLAAQEDEEYVRRRETEFAEKSAGIIVYGDDHVVVTTEESEALLGEDSFAAWVATVWGMKIQQIRKRLPLKSLVRNGELVPDKKGVVFLKHYLVECDLQIPNPPKLMPFRPRQEVCKKAVWGSSGADRTEIDVLLSTIGIAYGTMGTNPFSHRWLEYFYHALSGFVEGGMESPAVRAAAQEMNWGKLRTFDVSLKDILKGFPSLQHLQQRNSVDKCYHSVDREVDTFAAHGGDLGDE